MGIITQPTRALSQQVFSRASHLCTGCFATGLRRVNPAYTNETQYTVPRRKAAESRSILSQCRFYATATVTTTVTAPGRAKAHTGRSTATTRRTSSKSTKAAAKKKPAVKPKAKKRVKAKPKAKPKPRRRVLTEKQKEAKLKIAISQKTKDHKAKALLTAPKSLPATAWQVLQTEHSKGKTGGSLVSLVKEASATYKNITPEERERLNHIANENKAKNETAYQKWLSSYTPMQIKEANIARQALKRESKKNGGHKQYSHIQDSRLVKRPISAYTYFLMERNGSGDFTGMKVAETGSLVGKEWKALSTSGKKTYEDMADADKKRYQVEYKTVYGEDADFVKLNKATT